MRLKSPDGLRISRNSSISGCDDVEVAGRRAAAQRALADGEREAVHDAHERDDAAGLAVEADGLADAADIAPIGADAAALRREPDILVPRVDDAVEAVADRVEVAADRQAAPGAAVRQHGGRGHEPQLGNIVVDALGMVLVVGIGRGDSGKQILVRFAGQQIAVLERVLAEIGQQRVARRIGDDVERAGVDRLAVALDLIGRTVRRGAIARACKIHRHSPSLRPLCDGLFCICSSRSHGPSLAHFLLHRGLFWRASPISTGRTRAHAGNRYFQPQPQQVESGPRRNTTYSA